MEYEVKVNFYLEKEKEEYSAGDIIKMETAKAKDINKRAASIHPNLGEFLKELEEKPDVEVEKSTKTSKRTTKKDDEGADD